MMCQSLLRPFMMCLYPWYHPCSMMYRHWIPQAQKPPPVNPDSYLPCLRMYVVVQEVVFIYLLGQEARKIVYGIHTSKNNLRELIWIDSVMRVSKSDGSLWVIALSFVNKFIVAGRKTINVNDGPTSGSSKAILVNNFECLVLRFKPVYYKEARRIPYPPPTESSKRQQECLGRQGCFPYRIRPLVGPQSLSTKKTLQNPP